MIFSIVGMVVLYTGVRPFRRNHVVQWKWRELPLPGPPRNQKEKKNKSRGWIQEFIFQKLKIGQVLNTKKKKGEDNLQTSNKRVFANN